MVGPIVEAAALSRRGREYLCMYSNDLVLMIAQCQPQSPDLTRLVHSVFTNVD